VNQADPRYALAYRGETPAGLSPYRLLDPHGNEVSEVNEFLDAQATRGLSVRSLRAYGYSLLDFWRWILAYGKKLSELEEPDLWDYIRFQKQHPSRQKVEVAPKTVNHRLTAARCLFRFHSGDDLPSGRGFLPARSHPYHHTVASTQGYLHPARSRRLKLRVRTPRRLVVPLSAEDVRTFLKSLRTWRDFGITALMLSCGLRSREVIELTLDDFSIPSGEIRVRGKGDRERLLSCPTFGDSRIPLTIAPAHRRSQIHSRRDRRRFGVPPSRIDQWHTGSPASFRSFQPLLGRCGWLPRRGSGGTCGRGAEELVPPYVGASR